MVDLTAFNAQIQSGLKRKAIDGPAKWALTYRVMGPPYPGPWSFKYHPWLREMHESKSQDNIGMKGAQLGFTEHLMNIVFYRMDMLQQDCMYALPAQNPDATDFSTTRFNPAIELSDHLSGIFSTSAVGRKTAGIATLYIRGARSRSGFKSVPVPFLACDEVDEWDDKMIPLVKERMSGQFKDQWEMWRVSTPSIVNHGVHKQFLESSQDHFFFPCPHCGKQTELVFPECFELGTDDYMSKDVHNSYVKCKECQHELNHGSKHKWLAPGRWVTGVEDRTIRGFHVNQLYSSTMDPGRFAESFLRAQVNPEDEQEFYNSKLGVPHIVEGARVTDLEIQNSTRNYTLDALIPKSVITMGIDVGTNLHYEIVRWKFNENTTGYNLHFESTAHVARIGKCKHFEELDELIRRYRPNAVVIDANPERRAATKLANDFHSIVKMCFYGNSSNGRELSESKTEPTVTVDRTSWLDLSLGRWHNNTIELPIDTPEEYKNHIKALVRRYEKDKQGNSVAKFVNVGPDHYAHAHTYAEIAFDLAANAFAGRSIKKKVL